MLPIVASGCGPGSVIRTGEQAAFEDRVVRMDERLKGLESKKSAIDAGKVKADLNARIDDLAQEVSFIQSNIESTFDDEGVIAAASRDFEEGLGELTDRTSELEGRSDVMGASIGELRGSIDEISARLVTLEEAINATLAIIEGGTASPKKGGAAKATGTKGAGGESERAFTSTAGSKGTGDPGGLYMMGHGQTMNKEYSAALKTFRTFLSKYPDHELADNAQYWIGEVHYARGEWEKAILEFNEVIKVYPKGDKMAASLLKEGYSFLNLGNKDEARLLLNRVIKDFPGSNESRHAARKLKGIK